MQRNYRGSITAFIYKVWKVVEDNLHDNGLGGEVQSIVGTYRKKSILDTQRQKWYQEKMKGSTSKLCSIFK